MHSGLGENGKRGVGPVGEEGRGAERADEGINTSGDMCFSLVTAGVECVGGGRRVGLL